MAIDSAAYKDWLAKEVQEAIDDLRPSVMHSEVVADWATERAELVKRAEAWGTNLAEL